MNVSEVICAYLLKAGIDRMYGYPGDPNVELLEATRRADLTFILARREGTAALMAEAYGMVTGRPGVCVSTLGPGSTNLVNGVANAYLDRVPMIAISGQIDTHRETMFTHQVVDHNRLFSPISKWTTAIFAENAGATMRRALRTATAERPGPVHLTTHADIIGKEARDTEVHLPPTSADDRAVMAFASPGADRDIVRLMRECARPVILAGTAAQRQNTTPALIAFAEKIGAAVIVSPMAKGVFPEDHALFAGTLEMACNDFMWSFIVATDLLFCVGFDAAELIKPWRVRSRTIHVDATANTDQIYSADIELVGHIGLILQSLTDGFHGEQKWSARALVEHRAELSRLMHLGRITGRLNPTDVVDTVRTATPRSTIATTDVGSHKLLVGQGWTTHNPRGVLMSNGLSSMGFSVPAGIVARQLNATTPVVSFVGDGGLAMVQSELRLASSLQVGLTVVVFCDDSLNRIELKQAAKQYQPTGTRIDPTDVVKLAESMECDGTFVETEQALADAVQQQSASRPLVIGARIDPSQYLAQF